MRFAVALLLFLAAFSQAEAKRVPSTPTILLNAPLPPMPAECAGQSTLSGDNLRFVTLFGVVDWQGRATQVQVQDPSDDCLKEAAVETVREWQFKPVDLDANEYGPPHFETTLIYPDDGAPRYEMNADSLVKYYPAKYPEQCAAKARPVEMAAFTYDITAEGLTENIESVFSSFPCLTGSAVNALKKWRYKPRMIDGRAYPRTGVYTETTFELANKGVDPLHRKVSGRLLSIAATLGRKLDPRIALEKIALIDKQFGETLLDSEKAALFRYRGSAKIDALDYRGALEDLQAALALEKDESIAQSIKNVIEQLETALAATNEPLSESAPAQKEQ